MKFTKLYVWGPNPFSNRLLACHIEKISRETPESVVWGEDFNGRIFEDGSLIFCDCDKVDPLSYCRLLYRVNVPQERLPAIILMNVKPGSDLFEEVKSFPLYGIFFSNDSSELIDKGIAKVFEGEHWLNRDLLVRALQSAREKVRQATSKPMAVILTLREQEVLHLAVIGYDNHAIADQLFISPNTVKTHVSNIYKKINVTSRVQAILWASEHAGQLLPLAHVANVASMLDHGSTDSPLPH